MPSSRGTQKRSNKRSSASSSSTSQYPTAWSEWEWDLEKICWKRYRYKTADDYEVDYQVTEKSDQTSVDPRDAQELKSIPESSGSYQTSEHYTTSANAEVEAVTSKFSQLSTTPINPSYYASQTSQQPVSSFAQYSTSQALGSYAGQSTRQPTISFSQSPMNPVPGSYLSQGSSQLQGVPTHIQTRNPSTKREEFYPDYKVHKAYEFRWGRVFKVIWVEPKGQGGQAASEDSDASYTQGENRDGTTQFQKVRRFVIINARKGHCICLPINTYSKQGVTKHGVHAEDHTIAYSEKKPVYFHGERDKGLTKTPIKIVCSARHKLDERSRLNYAKTYTVEYNVKVCFIGKVDKTSEWHLIADFNIVHPPLEHRAPPPVDEVAMNHAEGGSSSTEYPTGTSWTGRAGPSTSLRYSAQTFSPQARTLCDIQDDQEEDRDDEGNEPEYSQGEYSGDGERYEAGYDHNASDGQPEGSHQGASSGR
ncbi:hypothetical protein ONS96_011712 [Cadophora gregata f. sp. sojae]|nr:hypothetical protein ONS96_011712 [Cadophora gregata f. sp. sojae]